MPDFALLQNFRFGQRKKFVKIILIFTHFFRCPHFSKILQNHQKAHLEAVPSEVTYLTPGDYINSRRSVNREQNFGFGNYALNSAGDIDLAIFSS